MDGLWMSQSVMGASTWTAWSEKNLASKNAWPTMDIPKSEMITATEICSILGVGERRLVGCVDPGIAPFLTSPLGNSVPTTV